MSKKKGRMREPFKIGLSGSRAPLTLDRTMDVILDPVNIKAPRKGKKRNSKK